MDHISLLVENKTVLIIVAVVLAVGFVVSLVKKVVKLAVVVAIALALNVYAIGFVSKFNDEFGFKYKNGVVSIDNKYNTGINFSVNDIKSVTVDKDNSTDKELAVKVTLKSGQTANFKIGSQYEQMVRDIISKNK